MATEFIASSSTISTMMVADASWMNCGSLSFENANVVWAVKNGPSTLYRLVPSGTGWKVDQKRSLKFKDGQGDPDAEGVVSTPDGLFVAIERDNSDGDVSAPMILKYGTGSNCRRPCVPALG